MRKLGARNLPPSPAVFQGLTRVSGLDSFPVRGPPISITCECGEKRSLRYGERWTCEQCGRSWNTEQIPAEDYRGFVRDLRRPKLLAVGVALGLATIVLIVALLTSLALLLTLPILLGGVAIFAGPVWKKAVRRRIAERPRWELHPE
jgi:hypothetical protein